MATPPSLAEAAYRMSAALGSEVTIPLTQTASTVEEGDYGTVSSITIDAGQTTGTGTISTTEDADTDDETFTVALDAGNLPSSVTEGSPPSVEITIDDDDEDTIYSLSAGGGGRRGRDHRDREQSGRGEPEVELMLGADGTARPGGLPARAAADHHHGGRHRRLPHVDGQRQR